MTTDTQLKSQSAKSQDAATVQTARAGAGSWLQVILNLVLNPLLRVWRSIRSYLHDPLLRQALRRPRLAAFYYAFFDRSFDRELHSVLHGEAAHENQELPTSQEACASLYGETTTAWIRLS